MKESEWRKMEIQYWGTAASEGWPALFCKCEACERARRLGGKNIRTRSQSVIDREIIIDMPPDTYFHALTHCMDLSAVRNILITHSHEDHFYPLDLILKAPPYARMGASSRINVYGNEVIVDRLKKEMAQSGIPEIEEYVNPVLLEPFSPVRVEDYQVTALLADHIPDERCYLYSVEKEGKRLLYAHDTGVFPKVTWEYLQQRHWDAVSLDCTFVLASNERGHMGLPNDAQVRREMLECGCADFRTKFIINHFSHNGGVTHEELSERAAKLGFLTAFDGMTVEF